MKESGMHQFWRHIYTGAKILNTDPTGLEYVNVKKIQITATNMTPTYRYI